MTANWAYALQRGKAGLTQGKLSLSLSLSLSLYTYLSVSVVPRSFLILAELHFSHFSP